MDSNQLALELHKKYGGKIETALKDKDELTRRELSAYYSPGVGAVSRLIASDPSKLPEYTWTNNLVAVISDGSSVLGLGNIGPEAAMPVMEGKAMLFKHFADIDSVPIVLNAHTPDEIVKTIVSIAPSFGAICLEDIAAPVCFEVEDRLKASLKIPIMHDDQHGTATVTLAGLINACKLTGRNLSDCQIVIVGAGAAGVAIAKLLHVYGQRTAQNSQNDVGAAHYGPHVIAVDSKGIISRDRTDLNDSKQRLLTVTNAANRTGTLHDAVRGADIFIGVSMAGLLAPDMVRTMAPHPIIFALANPDPEILPGDALGAGAAVIATGRSDYPNQVNNALGFPGIFRGALDNHVHTITDDHKIAAAEAIASLVTDVSPNEIIPSVFDDKLVPIVASVIK